MRPAVVAPMQESEIPAVQELLRSASLPFEDVVEHWRTFVVMRDAGRVVAAGGLELYGGNALVRSMVVEESLRNRGVGKMLLSALIEIAKRNGVQRLGLLTTAAEKFFAREGFTNVAKESVPEFIKHTKEFRLYCPSSSVSMVKNL